mgnify:CR=1 FL=1
MNRVTVKTCRQMGLPAKSPTAGLKTQKDIAEMWGLTRARIYQLENRALYKIKQAIAAEAAAVGVTVREWLYGDD